MSSARELRFHATVATRGEASSYLKAPGDAVLVERGRPRLLLLSCPCGCGEELPVNLDPRADKAWRLYRTDEGLTLFPSVWRDTGCQSHFVIWDSTIYWWDGRDLPRYYSIKDTILEDRVIALLTEDLFIGFVELADTLDEIPWAVLDACRRLVTEGRAIEGIGKEKSAFKKV